MSFEEQCLILDEVKESFCFLLDSQAWTPASSPKRPFEHFQQ
jgi:hypothetical protein